jgi:hypothetical protein
MVANVRKLAKMGIDPIFGKLFIYKEIGRAVPDWHRSCLSYGHWRKKRSAAWLGSFRWATKEKCDETG